MPRPPAAIHGRRPTPGSLPQHVPRDKAGMKTPGAISTVGVVDVDMAKYETSVEKNMVLVTSSEVAEL